MATQGTDLLALSNIDRRLDPNGKVNQRVAELLEEMNESLKHELTMEANRGLYHETFSRTSLGKTWLVGQNEGPKATQSTVDPVTFSIATAQYYCPFSTRLAKVNSNTKALRKQEYKAGIQSMYNKMAEITYFGDEGQDHRTTQGLSWFYSDKNLSTKDQIIDAKGTGTNIRDIWIRTHHESATYTVYPTGTMGGLRSEYFPNHPNLQGRDPTGGSEGFVPIDAALLTWSRGLVIENPEFVVRIANIDLGAVQDDPTKAGFTGPNIPVLILKGLNKIKDLNVGKTKIYMSSDTADALDVQAVHVRQWTLEDQDIYGTGIYHRVARGKYPIHIEDTLERDVEKVDLT